MTKYTPIHIIAFDIPYPANYGGIIVVYYHLLALHQAGVPVILHCFQYGDRKPQIHLETVCQKVYYYTRKRSISHQFSQIPFIVKTRLHPELLENLLKDEYPIFSEGLHGTGFFKHPKLKNRRKIARMHNVEWEYYNSLAHLEKHPFKKLYFALEAKKLKHYEKQILPHISSLITLSPNDTTYFKQQHQKVDHIGVFHPNEKLTCKIGQGKYLLFHAKLSVKDNEDAALYLVNEIAPKIDYPIKIAGLSPSSTLEKAVHQHENVRLHPNLTNEAMHQMIQDAHIHFLWTFQNAGMKLKLLNALFQGRFCIANELMIGNTGVEQLCHRAEDTSSIIHLIHQLWNTPFTKEAIENRKNILSTHFSNEKNVQKTLEILAL